MHDEIGRLGSDYEGGGIKVKNRNVVVFIILTTVFSGVCCFEGALFGHFSMLAMISSSVMIMVWFAALIYFAKVYKGAPVQKNLLSILFAVSLLVEMYLLFSGNDDSLVKIFFLPVLFVLCGFVDLVKQLSGISELVVYIGITILFLVVNLTFCWLFSEREKIKKGE